MTYSETKTPMLSPDELYHQLVGLDATIEHHESDLYTPVTTNAVALVKKYRFHAGVTTFTSKGVLWYSIPFAYLPFWEGRTRG